MALSNILREPRREITETLIGAVAVVPLVIVDYYASVWFYRVTGGGKDACPWPLGMILIPLILVGVAVMLWGLSLLIHAIGENISDWMADRGMDPRPKQRYQ